MLLRCLAILLALTTSTVLAASPPTVVNLSLQQHDAGTGAPTGWKTFGEGYDLHTECAPGCSVHMQSRDAAAKQFALAQEVAAGSAAGHRLILSGRIRTEQVDGNALLYVGVAGESMGMGEHTSGPATPSGTTAWKPFEVLVPVPANATKLYIGFGINGKGGAWFDSLALKVDESVTVPAAVPPPPPPPSPPPVSPPRPVPSQALLDDAALRIAKTDIPSIKEAWRADVLARRHPIRSLFSDDFSDLQFLKPLLAGKRVVQLGESSHGAAEMNWMKVRLIKFLHQEMGFDVVAFESSMSDCDLADRMIGSAPTHKVQSRCLMWQWYTPEVEPLFSYMEAMRKTRSPLTLAGFDTQLGFPTGPANGEALRPVLPASLGDQLAGYDAQLGNDKHLSSEAAQRLLAFYTQAMDALAGRSGSEIDFQRQALGSRMKYVRQLASDPMDKSLWSMRDAGMADNLNFLLDRRYPGRKVVVWAHNGHVGYGHPYVLPQNLGGLLAAQRKAEIYTIGLYMGRGVHADNYGRPQAFPAAEAGTLEGVLANGGLRYSLVDFSGAKSSPASSWMFEPITAREFGVSAVRMVPAAVYDAVLYIDTITPALKLQ